MQLLPSLHATHILAYILTNKYNSVLYIGITRNLRRRLLQHKSGKTKSSFTARYNVTKLVYYEEFADLKTAAAREKYIKGKNRAWKNKLVENFNPGWKELAV